MPKFIRLTGLLSFILATIHCSSQIQIGRIDSVKDVNGVICTYVGEIKGNKPNGRGMLIYPIQSDVIRHTGFFENGLPGGKGLLLFTNAVTAGNFLKGRPDGRVTFKNETSFGTENFSKGKSNGKIISVKDDNTISIYNTKEGKVNGLHLSVSDSGETMYNKRYVNGTIAGAHIQYQVNDNTLFEGYWKNGKWVKQPVVFKSLLKDKRFKGFKNDKSQGMGIFNKNSVLIDTGFLMSSDGKERYLGLFRDGQFISGALISGNLRFVGNLNAGKAEGICSILQEEKSLYIGRFVNDLLNDSLCVFLNLENVTTYIGNAVNGIFEGTGMSSTSNNIFYIGTYKQNMLEGECIRVYPSGYTITGTWLKDSLADIKKIADATGKEINVNPQSIEEGMVTLATHINQLKVFNTNQVSEKKYNFYDEKKVLEKVAYRSFFRLPGFVNSEIITRMEKSILGLDPNQLEYFVAEMKSGTDSTTAMKIFEELSGTLMKMQLMMNPGDDPVMLKEKKIEYKSGVACKLFEFPETARLKEKVTLQPVVVKGENGANDFSVILLIRKGDTQFFK